jgi:ribonuclease P protein component
MKQEIYLKKNDEFQKIYHCGKSFANKALVMYVLSTGKDCPSRLGMSVSKKVGNSVVRHQIKRLIREAHRLNRHKIADGYEIVVIARNEAKNRDYSRMERDFLHLAAMHHIIKEESV